MHALPHYMIVCPFCYGVIAQCACDVDDSERETVFETCEECKEREQ